VLEGEVDTPLGRATVEFVDPSQPVLVVPILRAGLVLLEQAATVLPCHVTHHFGAARDEATLLPTVYLNKLPATIAAERRILVTDPMLATGGPLSSTGCCVCFQRSGRPT
jgi:uracil phosphoribosyltransferase